LPRAISRKALFIARRLESRCPAARPSRLSEPSTGKLLAKVSDANRPPISTTAVAAARKALPKWSGSLGLCQRAKVLYAIGRAMQRHQRLFAVLETSLDNGKPIRESRDIDVPLAIRHFIHHAGWAQSLDQVISPATGRVGVVGQIIPWNFPLLMLAWKIAPGARRRLHRGA
jgi:aldehyde dehydrogenase (NAD+)